MSDKWKEVAGEELDPAYRERLLQGAVPHLERNSAGASGWWRVILRPAVAWPSALACSLAAAWLLWRPVGPVPGEALFLAYDPVMLRDADLFLDLSVLENLDELEAEELQGPAPRRSG